MTSHNEDKGHWHGDIQDGKMHFELPDATSTSHNEDNRPEAILDRVLEKTGTVPYSHNEAQKTKADWLRSEIEKLEGMKDNKLFGYSVIVTENPKPSEHYKGGFLVGFNHALTSIITRYKEELLELDIK